MGRCSGACLRVIVGHLINAFVINRSMMACLDQVWAFIERHGGCIAELPPAVARELAVARQLVLVAEHDWYAPFAEHAYISDSSTFGYALLETVAEDSELADVCKWKEVWRFQER
eukprot:2690794-Alexandrium_andersonii.AAC.1